MHLRRTHLLFCGLAIGLLGCTSALTDLLNPDFVSAAGLSQSSASLPGQAPAILLTVENRTSRTIDAEVSMRLGSDTVETFRVNLPPGTNSGQAVVCPVTELTLGDVSNLDRIGAVVRLGNGGAGDAIIEVEPFGVLLKEGFNYDCGDAITFAVTPSSQTLSGFQTIAFISRSGEKR